MPLEAAMREGETLRLFFPRLRYLGFATTIPSAWEDADCFVYEQRGWLRYWGRGQGALVRQAEFQMEGQRWSEADSTWRRVRALGDTLPEAVWGQRMALEHLARAREAQALADTFLFRWPGDPRARALRAGGEASAPAAP